MSAERPEAKLPVLRVELERRQGLITAMCG
jgi:hypothetical protein